MADSKKAVKESTDAMASLTALIGKAKKEGSIQSGELVTELEKLDLSVDKIEQVYETFDAMGIQIIGAELELDPDVEAELGDDADTAEIGEEEDLIDPVELAAEYSLDDPVRMRYHWNIPLLFII